MPKPTEAGIPPVDEPPRRRRASRDQLDAGNVSGQYLANTVLFATVLFFASAAGKFEQRRVRVVAFSFAAAVFAFAVTRIAILPLRSPSLPFP